MAEDRRVGWKTLFGISGGVLSFVAMIVLSLATDRIKAVEGSVKACEAATEKKVDQAEFNATILRMEGYMKELRQKDDKIIDMLRMHEDASARRGGHR